MAVALASRFRYTIVSIKAHHPLLAKLATLAAYFAYQIISSGFIILHRHFDINSKVSVLGPSFHMQTRTFMTV